jgi:hypothetical protein
MISDLAVYINSSEGTYSSVLRLPSGFENIRPITSQVRTCQDFTDTIDVTQESPTLGEFSLDFDEKWSEQDKSEFPSHVIQRTRRDPRFHRSISRKRVNEQTLHSSNFSTLKSFGMHHHSENKIT